MTSDDTLRARRWTRLLIAYWCFAFLITHIPPGKLTTPPIAGLDKVVHFCLYYLLMWLVVRAIGAKRGGFTTRSAVVVALGMAGYGAFDEWSQGFVGRIPSLADWFADLTGVAAAVLWSWGRKRRRTASPPPDASL